MPPPSPHSPPHHPRHGHNHLHHLNPNILTTTTTPITIVTSSLNHYRRHYYQHKFIFVCYILNIGTRCVFKIFILKNLSQVKLPDVSLIHKNEKSYLSFSFCKIVLQKLFCKTLQVINQTRLCFVLKCKFRASNERYKYTIEHNDFN